MKWCPKLHFKLSMMKENQNIKWKESWHYEYIKWVCGFTNVQGVHCILVSQRKEIISGMDVRFSPKMMQEVSGKILELIAQNPVITIPSIVIYQTNSRNEY